MSTGARRTPEAAIGRAAASGGGVAFGEQPGSVHLTFVSMIQAIALEWTISRFWALHSNSGIDAATLWVQTVGLVITVFWIWFGYSTLVISFRWRLSLADMLFPFGAGIGQFVVAGMMGTPAVGLWLVLAGVGYLVGGWVFHGNIQRILAAADGRAATEALRTAPLRRVFVLLGAVPVICFAIGILVLVDAICGRTACILLGVGDLVLLAVVVAWASVWRRIAAAEMQGA